MDGSAEGRLEPIELLQRVPLFDQLSAEELAPIASVAIPRAFAAGVRVFHEGDDSDACYVVRAGDLRVTREHSDGRAIALATLSAGDFFGELAMLDGGNRSASVETVSEVELLAVPAADMRRVIAEHGDIAAKLIVALTRRLRETNERVSRQSFQTVPSRVAGVLDRLIAEEATPDGRDGVTIRMNQADLAQLAGTSRESVSRFLATLERAGVVRVGRGRVTVVEPSRLRSYIFYDADSREDMVFEQLRERDISDERVLDAMAEVPREFFLPDRLRESAYDDSALPIGHGQTLSQPWILAAICEAMQLSGDERVLEVGTGSGYSAAVLARLAAHVVSIELIPELAAEAAERLRELEVTNVELRVGDGGIDPGPHAFDAIAVHAAAPEPAAAAARGVGSRGPSRRPGQHRQPSRNPARAAPVRGRRRVAVHELGHLAQPLRPAPRRSRGLSR